MFCFQGNFIKLTVHKQARTEHLTNFHVKINFRHLMLAQDIKISLKIFNPWKPVSTLFFC